MTDEPFYVRDDLDDAGPVRPFIGGLAALVGAVIMLIAYPMTWWTVDGDADVRITGFGNVRGSDSQYFDFSAGYLHWASMAAAILLFVIGFAALIGRFTGLWWHRIGIVAVALVILGTIFSYITDEDLSTTTGVYVVTAGAVISVIGTVMVLGRR